MSEERKNAQAPEKTSELSAEEMNELLKIRRDKLSALQAEGKDPFQITKFDVTHHAAEIVEHFDELENQDVSIAGRLMSWRDMGKASFMDLRDKSGRIQLYLKIDEIGEEAYADLKKWDIGDIVGVKGFVFRTRRGESPSIARRSGSFPNRCALCRRSSMASPIGRRAIVSGTST